MQYTSQGMDKHSQVEHHKNVESKDEERLKSDWTEVVKLNDKYEYNEDEFSGMLSEFQIMWNNYLDQIYGFKHLIDLTLPDILYIYSELYRAGLQTCQIDWDRLYKM